jgi:hypothetical protein
MVHIYVVHYNGFKKLRVLVRDVVYEAATYPFEAILRHE